MRQKLWEWLVQEGSPEYYPLMALMAHGTDPHYLPIHGGPFLVEVSVLLPEPEIEDVR